MIQKSETKASKVAGYVNRKTAVLSKERETLQGRATLAHLRKGIGKEPGDLPELWAVMLEGIDENLLGKGKEPSPAEKAVYDALTLYALHIRSNSLFEANSREQSFAAAAARMIDLADESSEERIRKKLEKIVSSGDSKTMARRVRPLITMMNQQEIPFDYAKFSADLYRFFWPENRKQIRLQWARDFYQAIDRMKNQKAFTEHKTEEKE